MKSYIIYSLLFISSNTFAQDSLRLVPVKAWQLSRLIQDATTLRYCDSLQRHQANELQLIGQELLQTNSALKISLNASNSFQTSAEEYMKALEGQKALTPILVKEARNKGRTFGAVISSLAWLALFLLL